MKRTRKDYNVDEVLKSLQRKHDLFIDRSKQIIYILKNKVYSPKEGKLIENPLKANDIGNGTWGKLDFLNKVCHWHLFYISNFNKIVK
jgi:hypothetical protein